ncbi:MAG: helix-turn-helix transcriptional regulator [Pseudonocardiales bacterium]|nr:helix-turn-helix transcriptional regulator [Pseudonocardiales bacterium]
MVSSRGTLRSGQGLPRCLGAVSGFLLKLIRESAGLTQVQLAERLGVDVASVQGWESGRRPLTALRAADLAWLRSRLVRYAAQPGLLAMLEDAIQADLVITHVVRAGGHPVTADEHPLGVAVHRRRLTNLITWPLTGLAPASLRDLVTARVRRGPVPDQPTLTQEERTRFFDHLLVTADTKPQDDTALAHRQAIYLLSFDTRADTADWLRTERRRTLRTAWRTDHVPSWVALRDSASGVAQGGDRDPLRAFLRHALTTDQLEQANLNYWAYWVGEIGNVQVDHKFIVRVDPRDWNGTRLLRHLVDRLDPGCGHAELRIHAVWALLLAHPGLLSSHSGLRSSVASAVEQMAADHDLSPEARRELSDIGYAVRLADR